MPVLRTAANSDPTRLRGVLTPSPSLLSQLAFCSPSGCAGPFARSVRRSMVAASRPPGLDGSERRLGLEGNKGFPHRRESCTPLIWGAEVAGGRGAFMRLAATDLAILYVEFLRRRSASLLARVLRPQRRALRHRGASRPSALGRWNNSRVTGAAREVVRFCPGAFCGGSRNGRRG
jgi:hypothetical protein